MHYHPTEQTLLVECSPGTIVVIRPKAEDFCERFCSHKVASMKRHSACQFGASAGQERRVIEFPYTSWQLDRGWWGTTGPSHETPASLKLKYP
jgi:hypothetical protein